MKLVLLDRLQWHWVLPVLILTIILGGSIAFFYLLLGMKGAVKITGTIVAGMAVLLLVLAGIGLLPQPWNLLGIVAILGFFPLRDAWKRRGARKKLLLENPDMTPAHGRFPPRAAQRVYALLCQPGVLPADYAGLLIEADTPLALRPVHIAAVAGRRLWRAGGAGHTYPVAADSVPHSFIEVM